MVEAYPKMIDDNDNQEIDFPRGLFFRSLFPNGNLFFD